MNQIEVGDKTFELFLSEENISKRIRLIGIQLNLNYENRCPLFIGVLNGSFMFMSDLLKEIDLSCEIGFIKVASYLGTESTGEVKELFGISEDLKGRDIILVEDIVDTGLTLKFILEKVYQQQPATVSICTLLHKPAASKHSLDELNYVGFDIPNDFVVGYGLDYDGLGRNLKDVYRAI